MLAVILLMLMLLGCALWRTQVQAATFTDLGWLGDSPTLLAPSAGWVPEFSQANLSKTEAEELLDWLEAHGVKERRLAGTGGKFSVAWRGGPPGELVVLQLRVLSARAPG